MEERKDPLGVVGQRAAGFTILALLAEGGMGAIYLAQRAEIGTTAYAVKCIPCVGSPDEIDALKKVVEQEALLLKRLSGANVPRYEGHAYITPTGKAGVVGCIFMEYLHGESLRSRITRRSNQGHALREVLALLSGAVTALAHAHRNVVDNNKQEIVAHLDLKPENIFLQRFGNVERSVLLDLGVARRLLLSPRKTTSVIDHKAFTLMYGAPEQFDPETFGSPGPHTDVFALALIIVEMLTGKIALLNLHCAEIPADYPIFQRAYVSAVNPNRRPNLRHRREPNQNNAWDAETIEPILERALAVDPHHRYVDVIDFWQDLCRSAGENIETEISSLSSIPPPVASIRPSLLPHSPLSERSHPEPQWHARVSLSGDTEPSPIPGKQRAVTLTPISNPSLPEIRKSLVPPPEFQGPPPRKSYLFPVALFFSVLLPLGIGWKITGTGAETTRPSPPAPSSNSTPRPIIPAVAVSTPSVPSVSVASSAGKIETRRPSEPEPKKKGGKKNKKHPEEKPAPACPDGQNECKGSGGVSICVDWKQSKDHCGACENRCTGVCQNGTCVRIGPSPGASTSATPATPATSVPPLSSSLAVPIQILSTFFPPPTPPPATSAQPPPKAPP